MYDMTIFLPIIIFLHFTAFRFTSCEGINSVSNNNDDIEIKSIVTPTSSFEDKFVVTLNTTQATSNNETGLAKDHPPISKIEYSTTTSKVSM